MKFSNAVVALLPHLSAILLFASINTQGTNACEFDVVTYNDDSCTEDPRSRRGLLIADGTCQDFSNGDIHTPLGIHTATCVGETIVTFEQAGCLIGCDEFGVCDEDSPLITDGPWDMQENICLTIKEGGLFQGESMMRVAPAPSQSPSVSPAPSLSPEPTRGPDVREVCQVNYDSFFTEVFCVNGFDGGVGVKVIADGTCRGAALNTLGYYTAFCADGGSVVFGAVHCRNEDCTDCGSSGNGCDRREFPQAGVAYSESKCHIFECDNPTGLDVNVIFAISGTCDTEACPASSDPTKFFHFVSAMMMTMSVMATWWLV
jgi:hypothetical protein